MDPSLASARVAVVSGKGGTGKTTVAAAVALAAANAGRRVLLLEVEGRNSIAPLFGIQSLGYTEREVAPNLRAESVIPDEALVEYLYLFYGIKRIGRALASTKAVDFATNVAPGLRDILLIGKVKEAERRRAGQEYAFDLVVVDAPPTGRLPRFLDAPRAVADLVHAGPIRTQAQGVLDMIADPKRLHVVLVSLPEDMSETETVEAAGHLEHMGVAVGPVVVNRLSAERFDREAEKALLADATGALAASATRAGVALSEKTIDKLASVASAQVRRARNERAIVSRLRRDLKRPLITLPALYAPAIGSGELRVLADAIAEQGALR
jgi:anion-transporting  ArsA/GET3 family ATPase